MSLPDYDDLCRYALKSQLTGYLSVPVTGSVVFTTGDQTISGNKTFLGATVLSDNSTPLTITNTEGSKTINLGNAIGALDLGTRILISSGLGTPTAILRAGGLPSTYGYGLVFGGGFPKKGYLTAANTLSPTGLSDATLVWTDRILSGQWRTNQRLLVNGTGVVLSGEAATPTNLASTGSTLETNINSLSGYVNSPLSNIVFTTGNQIINGLKTFTSHLSAASKSFLIDHPSQVNKKLQYGSLEGPEHGVFVRGKTNENIINLPSYWFNLVDENSISVNLTPISAANNIYVIDYNNQRVVTNGNNGNDYFYTVYGERKDIPKLIVEF